MRLGFFMMPVHPPARSFTDTLAEDTEKSLLADRLGFERVVARRAFFGDQRADPLPADVHGRRSCRAPETCASAPASSAFRIHDPVIVAAEVAQFDHMSEGRFMLGVGPGGLLLRFRVVRHTDVVARNRKVIEAVRIMQQIWSQDPPYDIDGEFWNVRLKTRSFRNSASAICQSRSRKAGRRSRFRWRARIPRRRAPPRSKAGASSPPISSRPIRWRRTGRSTARPAPKLGKPLAAKIGASRATSWSRRAMPKPMTACSAKRPPTAISSPTSVPCSAASGYSRSSSPTRTCPTRRRPPRPSPKAASSTARPRPCSTSLSPSATRSGRSARC